MSRHNYQNKFNAKAFREDVKRNIRIEKKSAKKAGEINFGVEKLKARPIESVQQELKKYSYAPKENVFTDRVEFRKLKRQLNKEAVLQKKGEKFAAKKNEYNLAAKVVGNVLGEKIATDTVSRAWVNEIKRNKLNAIEQEKPVMPKLQSKTTVKIKTPAEFAREIKQDAKQIVGAIRNEDNKFINNQEKVLTKAEKRAEFLRAAKAKFNEDVAAMRAAKVAKMAEFVKELDSKKVVEPKVAPSLVKQPEPVKREVVNDVKIINQAYAGYRAKHEKDLTEKTIKPKGWLSRVWDQFNKPMASLKQAAMEFGNALYVPDQVEYDNFKNVLNDMIGRYPDQYDKGVGIAAIDKFIKENRIKLNDQKLVELVEWKKSLVNDIQNLRYRKDLVSQNGKYVNDYEAKKAGLARIKKLAEVVVNVGQDKQGKSEVLVTLAGDARSQDYTRNLLQAGVNEVMYKLRAKTEKYRAKSWKKAFVGFSVLVGILLVPKPLGGQPDKISSDKVAQSFSMKEGKKVVLPVKSISQEEEFGGLKIYDLPEEFAEAIKTPENQQLIKNYFNLVSEEYESFDQFKEVCGFFEANRKFFEHEGNLHLLKNHPEFFVGVKNIEEMTLKAVGALGLPAYCQEMGIDYKLAKEVIEFNPKLLEDGKALRVALNTLKTIDNLAKVDYSGSNNVSDAGEYSQTKVQDIQSAYSGSNYSQVCETVNQVLSGVNPTDEIKPDTNEMLNTQKEMQERAEYLNHLQNLPSVPPVVNTEKPVTFADGGLVLDDQKVEELAKLNVIDPATIAIEFPGEKGLMEGDVQEDVNKPITAEDILAKNNPGPTVEEQYSDESFVISGKTIEEEEQVKEDTDNIYYMNNKRYFQEENSEENNE